MKSDKILYRILLYLLGLLILAFGVAFSINSQLGVSPVNSLPYVVCTITGFDIGTCVSGVFFIYVLAQILLLKDKFEWFNLLQILFAFLFGRFVDLAKTVLHNFVPVTYFDQLFMLTVSIILIAFGVSLYMDTKLIYMPMEGMTQAVASKFPKTEFHNLKIILDSCTVIIATLLSFGFTGELYGIREGTVFCALLVGCAMKPLQKAICPLVDKLCFNKKEVY